MQNISASGNSNMVDMKPAGYYRSLWGPLVILLALWAAVIAIVNPVGEFMVNDDWAFVRYLESLMHGKPFPTTVHGPLGAPVGPALITHLLWGLAFVKAAGFSLTVLRISVLTLGVLASIVLFLLLRRCGTSVRLSMLGTLTLMFNPLFFSQCFTFMTDITFTSFALVSVLFFHMGVERTNSWIIATGFLFALVATLTRQFGLVLPIGFVATCFLHSKGKELGRLKMVVMALSITVVPWMGYEALLNWMGSTSIIEHTVLRNALMNALAMDWRQLAWFLSWHLLVSTLGYVCFLTSPILALRYRDFWSARSFRYFVVALTFALLVYETMLLLGIVDPPVIMNGNVIFNLGIGPVVLKDTYIMGIVRSATLPKAAYAIIVYWTLIAGVVFFALVVDAVRNTIRRDGSPVGTSSSFSATNCLITSVVYMTIIVPLAPYDRYLILPCALLIVWIVSSMPPPKNFSFSPSTAVPVAALLMCLAVFSVFGTRDFLEMKRSLSAAHGYVVNVLKIDPCHVDGGFEFNGYHCYKKEFSHRTGLSWWWVEKEEYLVTLGPLPGYRVIRTFPFQRLLEPDGAVYLLEPIMVH